MEIMKLINEEHIKDALSLVWKVFLEFEAPDYCDEGIQEFKNYVEYSSIIKRLGSEDLLFWGCFDRGQIVGVIATRPPCHISMLFVQKEYHKKGIARLLLNTSLDYYIKNTQETDMTVNSSPYAIEIYHRLGFADTDKEQLLNGIRFTPMKYLIR